MDHSNEQPTLGMSAQQLLDNRPMGRRWWIVVICFLIIALDGADVQSASFVYPEFVRLWGVEKSFISAIVVIGLIAMAIGAFLAGPLADRYGRRTVVAYGIFLASAGTALGALSWSAGAFLVLRAITGLGLGAVMPITVALVSEFAPTAKRARVVTTVFAGYTAGAALSGYLAAVLVPVAGWRWYVFVDGSLSLIMLPIFLKMVPDSIAWLALQPDGGVRIRETLRRILPTVDLTDIVVSPPKLSARGDTGGIRLIIAGGHLRVLLAVALCYFIGLAVIYLFQTYFPLVVTQSGLQLSQAGILVAVFSVGGVVGALAIGAAMDLFGRFKVLVGTWILAIPALWLVAFRSLDYDTLLMLSFLWGILLQGANSGLNALAATLFPPAARATGVSLMHALGRFGAIFSGLIGGVAITLGWSIGKIFFLLGCPLIAGVGALVFLSWTVKARVGDREPDPIVAKLS